jgi:hypothetical protein
MPDSDGKGLLKRGRVIDREGGHCWQDTSFKAMTNLVDGPARKIRKPAQPGSVMKKCRNHLSA